MKNTPFKKYAWLLFLGLAFLFYSCEEEESVFDSQAELIDDESKINGKGAKVDICHNGRVINVSINALDAHQRHGDAVDLDGDGFFDIDNVCSETDCDDADPEVNPGVEGSCDEDPDTADLLVGTWTSSEIVIEAFVGTQTLTEYLIDEVGLSPEDAEAFVDELIDSFLPELTGTITINDDGTYESDFEGGSDSGTWELSADEMTLTLFEGADIIAITINSITETTWDATLSDDFPVDVDGDPGTDDVLVTVVANVILVK